MFSYVSRLGHDSRILYFDGACDAPTNFFLTSTVNDLLYRTEKLAVGAQTISSSSSSSLLSLTGRSPASASVNVYFSTPYLLPSQDIEKVSQKQSFKFHNRCSSFFPAGSPKERELTVQGQLLLPHPFGRFNLE